MQILLRNLPVGRVPHIHVAVERNVCVGRVIACGTVYVELYGTVCGGVWGAVHGLWGLYVEVFGGPCVQHCGTACGTVCVELCGIVRGGTVCV